MNVGCCIRNFIPLAELTRQNSPYIDGDSIYIKILVFKDPVPTDLLRSLMYVDPGLSPAFQKIWMEKESENKRWKMWPTSAARFENTTEQLTPLLVLDKVYRRPE